MSDIMEYKMFIDGRWVDGEWRMVDGSRMQGGSSYPPEVYSAHAGLE